VQKITGLDIEKTASAPYNQHMGPNTKYKDSVFTLLFSNPELLRELYCALDGVALPEDEPITINTLHDVLFLDRINDISFAVGNKLVILIEHQSTINPNMALRLLMYIARVYEKILGDGKIYTSQRIPVPRPEFFVLYNGVSPFPEEQILKLSDSFEETGSLGLLGKGSPALELVVRAININFEKNEKFVQKSRTLWEYSAFVAKVREFEKELGDKGEALKQAVRHCRDHDILKEFLEEHGTEVMNMLMTEWNWDDALAVRYEDGIVVGREEGIVVGREEGIIVGREEIARKLKDRGRPLEEIAEDTGLDIEAIKSLL
jgi:hypothetical protein